MKLTFTKLLRSILAVACINSQSFLLLSIVLLHRCTSLSNHLPTEGHWGCFQYLTINSIIKMLRAFMFRFLYKRKLSFCWDKCWVWLLGTMVKCMISFVKSCQIIFQSVCTILHSYNTLFLKNHVWCFFLAESVHHKTTDFSKMLPCSKME